MIDLHTVLDADKRVRVGNFFVTLNDLDTSLSMFESANEIAPRDMNALCNSAYVLNKKKRHLEAELKIKRALEIDPEHAHALGIYALIAQETAPNNLNSSNNFHAARVLFEHSLKNAPNDVTTLLNYAYMLQLVGDYPRALEIYTRARDLNIMDISTRFQRSMCLLTLAKTPEEWRQALDEYEIRHLLYNSAAPQRGKPMYVGDDGESGKTLLITSEQGIGDSVMMARYARHLKRGCTFNKVYLLVRKPWKAMMALIDGVDGVYGDINEVPEFDYFVPSMSLLRVEKYPSVKPSNAPYMRSISNLCRVPETGKVKIGLCWQGNRDHGNDRWRSISPDVFCDPFADMDGEAEFYSLQIPEENRFKPDFVKDVNISSLSRLAGVIGCMDLVVTVDTAILHIAGAQGIPTYALIAVNCDWRWQLESPRTEWYPSVTLFRSQEPLGWKPVLKRVRAMVETFIQEHRSAKA